jgi:hypothetical protein
MLRLHTVVHILARVLYIRDVYMKLGRKIAQTGLTSSRSLYRSFQTDYLQTGMNSERDECKHKYISDQSLGFGTMHALGFGTMHALGFGTMHALGFGTMHALGFGTMHALGFGTMHVLDSWLRNNACFWLRNNACS